MTARGMAARLRSRLGGPGLAGALLLALLLGTAVAAPLLAPYGEGARPGPAFARPGAAHPLGTDDVGHDLLSELLFGARLSLAIGGTAALAATGISTVVGLAGGYLKGPVDRVLMRLADVVLSLPFLPLMLVVGVFLGPGLGTLVAVIGGVLWAGPARELRAQVLSVRELEHVQAARTLGAGHLAVMGRHVLPLVMPLVVPQFVLAARTAILSEASLSFLGLGDPTARSWGGMLFFAHARSAFLTDAWLWWVLPPGLCIAAAVVGFALLGQAVSEREGVAS